MIATFIKKKVDLWVVYFCCGSRVHQLSAEQVGIVVCFPGATITVPALEIASDGGGCHGYMLKYRYTRHRVARMTVFFWWYTIR